MTDLAAAPAPSDAVLLAAVERARAAEDARQDELDVRCRDVGLDPRDLAYAEQALHEKLAYADDDEEADNLIGHLETLHAFRAGELVSPSNLHDSVDLALDRGDYYDPPSLGV